MIAVVAPEIGWAALGSAGGALALKLIDKFFRRSEKKLLVTQQSELTLQQHQASELLRIQSRLDTQGKELDEWKAKYYNTLEQKLRIDSENTELNRKLHKASADLRACLKREADHKS